MGNPTIDQLPPHEFALLNILVWLAPDPIPRRLLISTNAEMIWHEIGEQQFSTAEPVASLRGCIDGLVRRNVMTETAAAEEFCINEGYRELARNQQEQSVVWLMFALRLLNSVFPIDESQTEWNRLRPHILHATRHADFYKISEPTSELMSALSNWLIRISEFQEAEPLLRRALQFDVWNYGSHSLRAAQCCGKLAQILSATHRPFEASLFLKRAEAIEKCFDSDEPLIDGGQTQSSQELRPSRHFLRPEFLSRSAGEAFRDPIPMTQRITLHPIPPQTIERDQKGEHPADQEKLEDKGAEPLDVVDNEPPKIVDDEPVEQLSFTPSLYPPLPMEGISRDGRILFAYRCLLRSEEPLDCLGDNRHAVASAVSSILNVLLLRGLNTKDPIPTRSVVYDLIRDCVQQKKAASLLMDFDRSVAIQNVIRYLVSLDYAMGVIRAEQRQTSIAFAELVGATTALTKSHREAQEFDLRAIRNAIELYGTDETSTLPHNLLGELWHDDVD